MYTISTLTHIAQGDEMQALIKFTHNGKEERTTVIVLVSVVGNSLANIYTHAAFIAACNLAVADKIEIIDNPIV